MAEDSDFMMIDPPVGPFSPLDELRAWKRELEVMPKSEEVEEAIAQVKRWIQAQEGDEA